MINTLDDYICRSMPQWGDFSTNPNILNKVDTDGTLLPFKGNTVVFLLDSETRKMLKQIQDELYRAAPEMLAEPLQMSTFHMTLHDLANGKPEQPGLADYMRYTQERASQILPGWKEIPPLRMRATWLFNMVNTSIVLGLAPIDEATGQCLEEMYATLENVVHLGYDLTPHCTMAYFRPGTYSQEQVQRLSTALRKVDLDIILRADNLVLQNFENMNRYSTVAWDCL